MANEIAFTIKVNGADQSVKSIKEMEDALKGLESQFKSMKLGSAEFERTKAEMDSLKNKITDVKKTSEKASEIRGKFSAMGMGIAESFGNARAAVDSFGIANDMAVKGMEKASIAVRAVSGVTKAWTIIQTALNVVMTANPIGVIVMAVAALAAGIAFVIKPVREFITNLEFLNVIGEKVMFVLNKVRDWFADLTGLIDDSATAKAKKNAQSLIEDFTKIGGAYDTMIEKQKQELELMQAKGASEDELHKKRAENIANDIKAQEEYLKNLKFTEAEPEKIAEAEKKLNATRNELLKENAANETLHRTKKAEADKKAIEEAKQKEKEALKEREAAYAAYVQRVRAEIEKSKGNIVTLIDEQQDLLDERYLMSIKDEDFREKEALRLKQEREQLKLQASIDYLNTLGVLSEQEVELLASRNEEMKQMTSNHLEEMKNLELTQLEEKNKVLREKKLEDLQATLDDDTVSFDTRRQASLEREALLLEDAQLTQDERNRIEKEGADYRKKLAADESQYNRDMMVAKLEIARGATQAMMDLSDALFTAQLNNVTKGSAEEIKIKKKQFAVNKALQLTMAIITGIQAALNAWSSGMAMPIIGPATAAVYMGISIAMSAAQIAKIASTKFDPGSEASAPSSGEGSTAPAPSKFAYGGLVTGPGSSISDSVPALLSDGESVMNARSTEMFGGLLSAMNQAGGGAPIGDAGSQGTPVIKAYVVSSEMTTQQEADKKVADLARV